MFELARQSPMNADTFLTFVQCAVCGTVIGVLDDAASHGEHDGAARRTTRTEEDRGRARVRESAGVDAPNRMAGGAPDPPADQNQRTTHD